MIRLVTGRIGSGKSKVMDILSKKGYKCIRTDDVAKNLEVRLEFFKHAVFIFGKACLTSRGEIDKAYLWKEFMAKSEAFDRYDTYVTESVIRYIRSETMDDNVPVFVETALVQKHLDALLADIPIEDVIHVQADDDIRIKRLIHRGMTHERACFVDSTQGFKWGGAKLHVLDVHNDNDTDALALNVNNALMCCSFSEPERDTMFLRKYNESPSYAKVNTRCYLYFNTGHCSKCPFPCPQADWYFKEECKKNSIVRGSPYGS